MSTSERPNPVRYSLPLLLLLTVCLEFAEHASVKLTHSNWDLEDVMSKHSAQFPREVAYIVMAIIGVAGLARALRNRRREGLWNPRLALLLGLLLSWSVLSLLWTDTPAITAKRLFVLGLMFVGALGLSLSWTQEQILRFIALSAAIQVAIGVIAEIVYGYFTPFASGYRFAGTLPWNSQGYLCLTLILSAICVVKLKQPDAWMYRTLAVFGFVFLLLTRSRGALVALAVAMMLYFLVVLSLKRKVLLILLSGTIIIVLVMSGIGSAVVHVLNRGGEGSDNFTGREPLWEELMVYMHRCPWTGYGYEGFWTYQTIEDVSQHQHWSPDTAHSGYIECLLALGIIGAALHTAVLMTGLAEGIRLFRITGGLAFFLAGSLCFVYLVGGSLESLLIVKTSQTSFYFALLLCLTATSRARPWPGVRRVQQSVFSVEQLAQNG